MSSGGLSAARLRRLHDTLAGYVERGDVPGVVTLVWRRGALRVDAIGALAYDGPALQPDSIFRISSMTKPIAAVAALSLIEEGRLRLDDAVDELLPELANRRVLRRLDGPLDDTLPAARSITVRDLLTFRMGFGQLMASPDDLPILKAAADLKIGMGPPDPQGLPPPDEWLRRLGSLPLMYQPGARWLYNTAADVLGVLVARAAAQPLDVVLQERVFAPLGMRDTGFSVPADQLARLATGYGFNPETGARAVFDPPDGQWSRPPTFPAASGGLVSTAADMLAFGRMLLDNGRYPGGRILARPTVQLMTTDQLNPEQRVGADDFLSANRGWGFGVSMVTRRDEIAAVPGRFGWEGGLGTSWATDPAEELVAVLLTQMAWSSPSGPRIWNDFWTLTYAALDD